MWTRARWSAELRSSAERKRVEWAGGGIWLVARGRRRAPTRPYDLRRSSPPAAQATRPAASTGCSPRGRMSARAHVACQAGPQDNGWPALPHPGRPSAQSAPTSDRLTARHLAGWLIADCSSAETRCDFGQTGKFHPEWGDGRSRCASSDKQMKQSLEARWPIVCRNGAKSYNDIRFISPPPA